MKSTIHWVSAAHAIEAEARLYETLFTQENPNDLGSRPGVYGFAESAFAGGSAGLQSWSPAWPARRRQSVISLNGWVIFVSTPIRFSGAIWCLIVQWPCAIPGPKSKRKLHKRNNRQMVILGIGGLLGDAACAALKNGELVAAVEEAKVSRGFRPGQIPLASIDECLRSGGRHASRSGMRRGGAALCQRPGGQFPPDAARSFPEGRDCGGGAPSGACRVGVFRIAF